MVALQNLKNQRRQYLINPGFQLRFSLLITLAMFVFNMAFPFFIYAAFDLAMSHKLIMKNPTAADALREGKSEFIILMVILETVFIMMTFVMALFHSHKIAGPLYKLRIAMSALKQGVLDRHISFRAKDNFPELADEFNEMSDAIFARRRLDLESINNILPKVEQLHTSLSGKDKDVAGEILKSLQNLSRGVHETN